MKGLANKLDCLSYGKIKGTYLSKGEFNYIKKQPDVKKYFMYAMYIISNHKANGTFNLMSLDDKLYKNKDKLPFLFTIFILISINNEYDKYVYFRKSKRYKYIMSFYNTYITLKSLLKEVDNG
jgi:hypothetical protein